MTHGFAEAPDGARLAYQLQGTAGAPPLLLLQGQANSHAWWSRLREPFAARYRTITFDYRGTGETEAPPENWSTSSFADDAAAVLDHLGYERARVYGTSMGGRIAQMLALRHPGRVSGLVLACTAPGGPHARERGHEVRRMLAQADPRARRAALLELMYTPRWTGATSTLLGDPVLTPDAARRHLKVSAGHDAYADLPTIDVPTLVLHGSDDRMAPVENARLLAERIPGARLVITPAGRHGFFDEFSATVTPAVLDFLE